MERIETSPGGVFAEYTAGANYKSSLGSRGMYEQNKINERFYAGDQWHGAQCGTDRPLVRHNVIKRIGDYKTAIVGASPVTVNYTADGVPNTVGLREKADTIRREVTMSGQMPMIEDSAEEITVMTNALSDYFRTTAERLKFDDLRQEVLRKSYISGTGVLYTWWDDRIETGLYADEGQTQPIKGDIKSAVIDIENVYFGDPNQPEIQEQPWIIISQRRSVAELRREARRNRRPSEEIARIVPDRNTSYQSGDRAENEPEGSQKTVCLTKLYKVWDKEGDGYRIKAVKVTETATIRPEWDLNLRLYPLAKFEWERRASCAYGDSEITWLVPNQIAINRMLTASVWACMMMGMPIMVVNGDIITQPVTNDPAQIIKINGGVDDVQTAIRYVQPPSFGAQFDSLTSSLIQGTLTQAGANDAALGDVRPDNTSAIIAVREAATMPLQSAQNRFYSFCEDVARIWADFWVHMYGVRSLKIEDSSGTWYMPFDGEKYKNLLLSVRVDVGAAGLWSEIQSVQTLDNLLERQIIDVVQYLERMPKGVIPDLQGLLKDIKSAQEAEADIPENVLNALTPEERAMYDSLPPEIQSQMMATALGGVKQ